MAAACTLEIVCGTLAEAFNHFLTSSLSNTRSDRAESATSRKLALQHGLLHSLVSLTKYYFLHRILLYVTQTIFCHTTVVNLPCGFYKQGAPRRRAQSWVI